MCVLLFVCEEHAPVVNIYTVLNPLWHFHSAFTPEDRNGYYKGCISFFTLPDLCMCVSTYSECVCILVCLLAVYENCD